MTALRVSLFMIFISLNYFGLKAQVLHLGGIVLDESSLKPLSNISVSLDRKKSAITDSNGVFNVQTTPGKHVLGFSRIGYKNQELKVEENLPGSREFQVLLTPNVNQLDQLVIAGSRGAKQVSREVTTVNLIQPYLISNTNSADLSEVLNKVPGVSVIDGQAVIRGGVGFSYNTGSRVAVLLEDMPLLGADLADARWNFLPIEAAEQIEVIKGSASVLYGSSAMNGTVNVRTGWGTTKPQTKFQFYQGIMSNPDRKEIIWWSKMAHPMNAGMFYSHKQSWGKFDLVLSGNLNAVRSHLYQADQYRLRNYIKTRYRFSKNFSAGINMNLMFEESGRFFLWHNADSGTLKPLNNYVVEDDFRVVSFDPHAEWVKGKSSHSFKGRFYQVKRFVVRNPSNLNENDAVANIYAFDYNFKRNLMKGLDLVAGSYMTTLWAVGNVYKGEFAGYSVAGFAQADYRYKRWSFVLGGRYEINALASLEVPTGLLKRAGINYQMAEKTFLRWNYSEGFRFPTIGEKFVEDKASDLRIFPNNDLVSEKGWTSEFGIQQGFRIGNFQGNIDFAVFNQEFDSMIEFRFDQWLSSVDFPTLPFQQRIGFKAMNIGKTRAAGFELSINGEGRIGPVLIRTIGGISLTLPVNLSTNPELADWGNYWEAFKITQNRIDSGSTYYTAVLAYRNRKTAKWDIEATLGKFSMGYAFNYIQLFEKIDPFLVLFGPGLRNYYQTPVDGNFIHNVRVSIQASEHSRISLLINNLTNQEYATRIGKIDPFRNFNIQLKVLF